MIEPRWVKEGRKLIGVREIGGPRHAPDVLQMWRDIKRGGIRDDETPWCAAFVGAMLERSGVVSSRFESAKSYLSWGLALPSPALGCIVVFERGGGGHVGFVVGQDRHGALLVLGGNQSDEINVRAFQRARVADYRWPAGEVQPLLALPVLASVDDSVCEA